LESFACVAIFAGQNGHTKGIISVSWHPHGDRFATSGYDHFIRLWNISNPSVSEALQASFGMTRSECRNAFRPIIHQFPYFATRKVHNNYVDCVQWLGHMILSKSTHNQITLWEPDLSSKKKVDAPSYQPPDNVIVLQTFEISNCNNWSERFGIDLMGQHLAVENLSGEVDERKIDDSKKEPTQKLKEKRFVRFRIMAFSPDGKTLVSCADDATISRWDLV
jgi:polycomb protein EED